MPSVVSIKVFLWSNEWGTDSVEIVVPEYWPNHELDKNTLEGDYNFANWVFDNTGLSCTVERILR